MSKPSISKLAELTGNINIIENILIRPARIPENVELDLALRSITDQGDFDNCFMDMVNQAQDIVTVPQFQDESVTFPNLQNEPVPELQNESLPKLQNEPLPELQNEPLPELQNGSIPELQNEPVPMPVPVLETVPEQFILNDIEMQNVEPLFEQMNYEQIIGVERDLAVQQIADLKREIRQRLEMHTNIVNNCSRLLEVLDQREDNVKEHFKTIIKQNQLMRLVLEH